VNRTSPRTQSSLLEAMEEHQVTADGATHPLPDPFLVVATLNPIELTGTFPLPEAQIDRFLIRLALGYPSQEDEIRILGSHIEDEPVLKLTPVISIPELLELQRRAREVTVVREIRSYIVAISDRSRRHTGVRLGLSPRGTIALMRAAQAFSFLNGSPFVTPDAVKAVAVPVMGHRLVIDPEREAVGSTRPMIVREILSAVAVPTLPDTLVPAFGGR
jgi:MoxR-like ATPase